MTNVARNEKGAGDVFGPILARDPLYKRVRGTMLRARQLAGGGQETTADGIVESNEKGKEEEEEGLRERDPEMHSALETVKKAIALIRRTCGRHQQATAGIPGSSERGVMAGGGGGERAGRPRSGDVEMPAVALLVSEEGQVSESERRVHKATVGMEEGGSGQKAIPASSSPQPLSTPRRVEGGSKESRRKRIGAGITRLTRRLSGGYER